MRQLVNQLLRDDDNDDVMYRLGRKKRAVAQSKLRIVLMAVVVMFSIISTGIAQSRSDYPILGRMGSGPFGFPFFQPSANYGIGNYGLGYSPVLQPGRSTSVDPAVNVPQPLSNRQSFRSPFGASGLIGSNSNPSLSSIPEMFGDFFGGRPPGGIGNNGAPPRGGVGTRSVKLSENVSPQPRTRTFFSYHFFNDVLAGTFGDVNRYSFGIEISNLAQTASIDIRLPIANTISNEQVNGTRPIKDTEIGNANIVVKRVLVSGADSLVSAGLGLAVPTADDSILNRPGDHRRILHVRNKAVHILPFVGYIKELGPRLFSQGFIQLDADLSGNEVFGDVNAGPLRPLGVVQDPTLLFVDVGLGYRMPESTCLPYVNSWSFALEMHYATTVQDTDLLRQAGFTVGDATRRFDVLNMTLGSNFGIGNSVIRPGFVVPLRKGDDRQFDYEIFLQINRNY